LKKKQREERDRFREKEKLKEKEEGREIMDLNSLYRFIGRAFIVCLFSFIISFIGNFLYHYYHLHGDPKDVGMDSLIVAIIGMIIGFSIFYLNELLVINRTKELTDKVNKLSEEINKLRGISEEYDKLKTILSNEAAKKALIEKMVKEG
jgi:predicted PurR-regulated permease PerM